MKPDNQSRSSQDLSRPRQDVSRSSQDVANLRPGQGRHAPRSEFQTAEAETVLFASARAMPLPEIVTPSDVREESYRYQIHPRRTWLSRAVVALILLMQMVLTLRMNNSAFEDEALYLYVGHLEIAHWLHGAALQGDYPSYFSGAPVLYPVLGAVADSVGGLVAARAVSLIEMLLVTTLVYSMTRRLFNERVALCAGIVFAVSEPTLYLGHLATYDASALCLLTIAAWLVVRTAAFRWPVYLLAAPIVLLAVATKYATLLFVPSLIALTGLAAPPERGGKALFGRPAALTAFFAVLCVGLVHVAGPDYMGGFKFTTLERFEGTTSTSSLLWDCAQWIGVQLVLAVIGAVAYARRPATETRTRIASAGTRLHRALLGAVLGGTILLAPIEQIRIHTETSLYKHVGFGLMFAAPIVGVGLARVIGDHFRRTQIGIAVWCIALVVGMTTANNNFNAWPNSALLVADMTHYLRPDARYLVEVEEVPIYYLRNYPDAQPRQFTSTYFISYYDAKQQKSLTGNAGYEAAIKAGYFQVVAYNYQTTPGTDAVIAHALAQSPHYRLANVISNGNNTVRQYIWVRSG
jgi:4-amino-4-deoxy-L-arabinose transferase-like glycosyltransferase